MLSNDNDTRTNDSCPYYLPTIEEFERDDPVVKTMFECRHSRRLQTCERANAQLAATLNALITKCRALESENAVMREQLLASVHADSNSNVVPFVNTRRDAHMVDTPTVRERRVHLQSQR